jgi:peroxiredoxin
VGREALARIDHGDKDGMAEGRRGGGALSESCLGRKRTLMISPNLSELPADLPRPSDDGAARHLPGMILPKVVLAATDGSAVDVSMIRGRVVIYLYPMTGRPGVPLPDGWDALPGARGCTPQSCAFRDHFSELKALGTSVFGLSTQTSEYQKEARDRLHLPFELLSDAELRLKKLLRLPTFSIDGLELYRRLTLVITEGRIDTVFYPVFPPDRNAGEVLAWLKENRLPR